VPSAALGWEVTGLGHAADLLQGEIRFAGHLILIKTWLATLANAGLPRIRRAGAGKRRLPAL